MQLADDRVAPGGDAGVIELHLVGVDPELLAADRHPVVELRGFKEDFGRDAAHVQARAAELVGLHQGNLQPELGGSDRRGVAAHPTSQDRDVEV